MTNGKNYKVIKMSYPVYRGMEMASRTLDELASRCEEIAANEIYEGQFNGVDYCFHIQIVGGETVHTARNQLVYGCSKSDTPEMYANYFMQDSDVYVPIDGVIKLIEADKDIIAGAYEKLDLGQAYAFDLSPDHYTETRHYMNETGMKKVSWAGTGAMCIKSEVFKKTCPPWFYFPKVLITNKETGERRIECYSEDKTFCLEAARAGFETWCDFDVKCEHFNLAKQGVESFKFWKKKR